MTKTLPVHRHSGTRIDDNLPSLYGTVLFFNRFKTHIYMVDFLRVLLYQYDITHGPQNDMYPCNELLCFCIKILFLLQRFKSVLNSLFPSSFCSVPFAFKYSTMRLNRKHLQISRGKNFLEKRCFLLKCFYWK